MTRNPSPHPPSVRLSSVARSNRCGLGAAHPRRRGRGVAVYDAPPYGSLEPDGSIDGVSVDLWRRAAEVMGRRYRFVPVSQMGSILEGLERNEFDAEIGAITITPERLARVDFSYPALTPPSRECR